MRGVTFSMITKDQAVNKREFHFDNGHRQHRGCAVWRRNGRTITWKREHTPDWSIPLKFGLYDYRRLESNDQDVHYFHAASDCPSRARNQDIKS